MAYGQRSAGNRIAATIGTLLIEGAIVYALIAGLTTMPRVRSHDPLKIFEVDTPPPPPPELPPPPPPRPDPRKPDPIPPPVALPPRPAEVTAPPAEVPAAAPAAPAASPPPPSPPPPSPPKPPSAATPAVLLSGRPLDSDYTYRFGEARVPRVVTLAYIVEADGRVGECRTIRSSGDKALDATACRIAQHRFKFKPALDADGHPIRSIRTDTDHWYPQGTAVPQE